MSTPKERIIGLDVLRTLAITAVLFAHTIFFLSPLKSIPVFGAFLDLWIRYSEPMSIMGVELFFSLSGFLIGGILIKQYVQNGDFGKYELKIFLIKRWLRTLPLYWLILTINIILYTVIPRLQGFQLYKLAYYPFLQNLFYPHPPYFFGEAWSLSVEEWFYIMLPVSFLLSLKLLKIGDKKRFLFRFLLTVCFTSMIIRFLHAFSDIMDQDSEVRKIVLYRMDALIYGVLCAYFSFFHPDRFQAWSRKLLMLASLCIGLFYYLLLSEGGNITRSEIPWIRFTANAFLYTGIPLTFALLMPYAVQVKQFKRKSLNCFFGFISRISYSVYLTHYSLLFIPTLYRWNFERRSTTLLVYSLYLFAVIGLSYLLHRFVESPFMRKRELMIQKMKYEKHTEDPVISEKPFI